MGTFEVLINDSFDSFNSDLTITPSHNKKILSLINDFQDGDWRYQKFQEFIWNNISETALSLNERKALIDNPYSSIIQSSKNLRLTDLNKSQVGQGSELAEIVLYGIMKHYYNALSVVPKIFYKQNSQDNAKGADSVHIVIEGDDDFSLWFGEAKFYNSIEDVRLDSIVASVENSLKTEKLDKENSILTSVSDLDQLSIDSILKEKIKKFLVIGQSMDNIRPKLNIPILLLHECLITQNHSIMSDQYRKDIKSFHQERATSYFKKQVAKIGLNHQYDAVRFHIILLPVPLKDTVVNKFIDEVKHLKK